MHIKEWGETGFIHYLQQQFSVNSPLVGIGDDCAVIPMTKDMAWLVTTDALIEGVHFLKEKIGASQLGYKTIAVNVSDIAAMGGEPRYAFLSIALPKNTDCNWLNQLVQGMKEACQLWNISLLGGDTVGSKNDLFLNITLIGTAHPQKIKYRHQAQVGDMICLTNDVGNAGGGLKALQNQLSLNADVQYLIDAHFHPQPSTEQGKWLASHSAVHAMMDISDGLDCDLRRLIKASQCGAMIEITQLPISKALLQVSQEQHWVAFDIALTGGEDYCLLLTIAQDQLQSLQSSFHAIFGKPLYAIGQIIDLPEQLIYQLDGKPKKMHLRPFDHFQSI
jgi:thiamine-monophosphate kinase